MREPFTYTITIPPLTSGANFITVTIDKNMNFDWESTVFFNDSDVTPLYSIGCEYLKSGKKLWQPCNISCIAGTGKLPFMLPESVKLKATESVLFTIYEGYKLSYTSKIVDNFSSLNGWTGSGAGTIALTDAPPLSKLTNALRLTSTGANGSFYQGIKAIQPDDYSTGWYSQWVRSPNLATSQNYGNFFWRDPFSSNGYYQRFANINALPEESIAANNEWVNVMWLGSEMNNQAPAPAYNSNTTWFNRLYVRNTNTLTGGIIDFGQLRASVKQSKAIVCFTFDDSNDTDYTIAYPYLSARDIRATTYTIANQIGQPNFLTLNQLRELDAAGWTCGTHGEFSYTTLTNPQLILDLEYNKNFLINNNISGWRHLSYPLGDFNPSVVSTIKQLKFKSARTTIARNYPLIPERGTYHLQGEGSSAWASAADGIASINSAIANGGTCIIFTHRLQPVSSPTHTSETIWKAVVDHAVAMRSLGLIDIMTMEQLTDAIPGTDTTYLSLIGVKND